MADITNIIDIIDIFRNNTTLISAVLFLKISIIFLFWRIVYLKLYGLRPFHELKH